MKKKLFVLFELIVVFILSTCVVTFAWLSAAKNTINTFVTGSLVSDYFHCGSGTEDDPFVITRPIHYYHMTEFFQRNSEVPVVYRYSETGEKEFVKFGTDKLYFQIGCPEEQLRNKDLRPALNGETGSGYFTVDENTEYYVFDYNNSGEVIKESTGEGDETQDAKSQILNMAYYSSTNALMPLGSSDKPFYGVFDGSGLTITNLNIVSATTYNGATRSTCDVGIFGVLKCDTTDGTTFVNSSIKDCYFDNVTISSLGATISTTCSVTGSTHDSIYMGYLVGHLYSYKNATGRDYQLNTVSTSADPVSNVYINNATISGGTSDSSVCNFGYFGHVDLLDGESAVAIASQVDEMDSSGQGDEGWGGSIDMTSLYNRLNVTIGSNSSTRSTTVPTEETIVAPSSTSGTAKTTIDETQSAGKNDNRTTVYYWSAADLKSVSTHQEANTTGGTIIGTQSSSWIYLYGMHDLGTTTVTTYTKSGDEVTAYYISDNNVYIANDGTTITEASISKNASKFIFNSYNGTGTIMNYGENVVYYLKATSDYTGIELTTSEAEATKWTHNISDGKNYISCKNASNANVYLVYDSGWQLVTGVNYFVISDGNSHYLSANTSGILNITNESDSVSWQRETSGDDGYKFYFTSDEVPYYLAVVNGKLTVSKTSDSVWTKTSGSASGKYAYYTTQGGSNFYLIYDNGWRAKELQGYVIYNGTHYLSMDSSQISSTSSDNATMFHLSSTTGNTTISAKIDGLDYYLSNNGTSLIVSSTAMTWNKDSLGYYVVVDSTNYYLVYQDGWKLTILTGYKIYSDSQYLTYQVKTSDNVSTYNVTSTTESNACLWQISNNTIFTKIGNDSYYLILNDECSLELSKDSGNRYWYQDSNGYYTYKNATDKFYLTYDKGFKGAIRSGYRISDGDGHYLSKSGTAVVSTDESNATIWQITNTDILGSNYSTNQTYIYTLVGTTRYYLFETSGSLGLVIPTITGNMVDYSTISSGTMTTGANNMTIEYDKDEQSFALNIENDVDPYVTIDHTVYLVAGTTYYMHIDVSLYGPNLGIQIFYAINGVYSEGNSRHFYNNSETLTFTVDTTGTYNFRFDNDCHTNVTITNFYIGTENYYGPWSNYQQWNRNDTGYYISTESDDNLYLNYNSTASKWELIVTGGFYIYTTIDSTSYYLNTTGTTLTAVTSEANAATWHLSDNVIYTYIGTTKYYLLYEETTTPQYDNEGSLQGDEENTQDEEKTLLRRSTNIILTLTTAKVNATNWLTDSNEYLYMSKSYSNLVVKSTEVALEQKFYMTYDTNDSIWKLKADLTNGYTISGSNGTFYLGAEYNESSVPVVYAESDSNYATVWYKIDTKAKDSTVYTFIGTTAVVLAIDFSSGTDIFSPSLSTGSPVYGWSFNEATVSSSTYAMKMHIKYNTTSGIWQITRDTKYYISYSGNYLSIEGTSIANTTNKSTTRRWIIINSSRIDGVITESDSRFICTMIGNNIYVLRSDSSGNLYLYKDNSKYYKNTDYYWYKDSIGYYQIVDGINMYLTFDGSKWKTTPANMLITEYNTDNCVSILDNTTSVGIESKTSATEWKFAENKIYTELNSTIYYLNASIDGTVSVSTTSVNTWSLVATTNGVSIQTTLTLDNGYTATYYLDKSSTIWKVTPLNYTTINAGTNYLAVNDSGALYNSDSTDEYTKIYISNASSGKVSLFVIRNNVVYYLGHDVSTLSLTIGTSSENTDWTSANGKYQTDVAGETFMISYDAGTWTIHAENLIRSYTSNGATFLTRYYVDSSNRVYEIDSSGQKIYFNFENSTSSKITRTTSTTNAMLYDSTNNRIYLGSCILYKDNLASGEEIYNVYQEGSFTISSGSNYLRINSTTTIINTTDATCASYFVSSNSANHGGTLYTYFAGQKVFLTYNDSNVLTVSSSGSSWENIGSASSDAGTYDVLGYLKNSGYYCINLSGTTWSIVRASGYKISNTADGSGTGFISHNGTKTGYVGNGSCSFVSKSSATIWTFIFTSDEIDGISHVYNSTNYYLYASGSWIVGFTLSISTSEDDNWTYENNCLSTYHSSYDRMIYYGDTSTYLSRSTHTAMYLYPDATSLTFTTVGSVVDATTVNVTSQNGTLASATGSYSVREFTIEYSGSFSGITFSSVGAGATHVKAVANTVTISYCTKGNFDSTVLPNATIVIYENPSNVSNKYVTLDDAGTEIETRTNTASDITVTEITDIPSITMIETTDKPFSPTSDVEYQRGCYVALRIATQEDGSYYSDYRADNKNTGYIVGGDYSSASGSGQGDIRVSGYDDDDISGSYSARNEAFTTIYTFNDSGLQAINESANTYTEYTRTKADFLQTVIAGDGDVYGIHFMDTQISTSHIISAESVLINGKTYVNYELPESCIDFNVYQKGTIVLYAGDYYSGNSCFFSLNQIFRNNNNEITGIKEIELIYEKNNGTAKEAYIYKYTDGTYSKTISSSDLASNYTCVFKTSWLTNPNNGSSFSHDYIYYFEIPCNKGEYALGSVSGSDGGYLLYLDIASNGSQGATYNQDAGISDEPIFTQIDFRSSDIVINSPLNFAYTIPTGSTTDNFQITMSFDGEYIYTLTINNTTGQEMDLSVLLVDNDDDPDNVFPYEYKIVYNGSLYTLGTGYNDSTQSYSTTATYQLPASSG